MYYSETYKVHWWGPPRIASRALSSIPQTLKFKDNRDGHNLTIINPEWEVILPIRNPYSRAVSWWNLRHNGPHKEQEKSFEEYIDFPDNEYLNMNEGHLWEPISTIKKHGLKIKNVIRYEYMVDDLMKIDFVENNFDDVIDQLFYLKYNSRKDYRKEYLQFGDTPVCKFYNQRLADIVWEAKRFEFEEWGYQRDSWKKLL